MNLEKYQQYSRIARGLEKADLVLKDARIVNVFTEEIIRGDIAIQDGIIAGIGSFHGKKNVIWLADMYVRDLLTAIFIWNLHWLHRLNW